jgi:UDP-N-acetylmuramate dehydrogenase
MQLFEHFPLKDRHTFHIDAFARYWADFDSVEALRSVLKDPRFATLPKLAVGGGSNLLFTGNYEGLLLHSTIQDLEFIPDGASMVRVRAGSGLCWDDLVEATVRRGWCGLENLSGIPGNVGASPVQNVGAYGAEAKDCIVSVEAMDVHTLEMHTLSNADCRFGYRDSRFKKEWKDRFIICYVTFSLSKEFKPNIRYGELTRHLEEQGGVTLEGVRQVILNTRAAKLPDPEVLGNAGSFFMNPEIPNEQWERLRTRYPDMPHWLLENGRVKVSAAWCIDKAGWKGKRLGNAAVHDKQALVLVNVGGATAGEVTALCEQIVQEVEGMFGIRLKPEVLFI